MITKNRGKALAIYVGESDHIHGKPVYIAVIEAAKEQGLAGATAGRAIMGFGAHSRIHTTNIVVLSEDLPVVICIVDTEERIEAFLPQVEALVREGTIVSWEVDIEVLRREKNAEGTLT
jgi:PII-like signaling protein